MHYLLDTNVWIHYLKNASSPVASRLQKTPASEVVVCSVVWAELLHGARKYERRDDRVARVERTLSPYQSLPFNDAAARRYAVVRDDLESRGEVIGSNDLLIAAIALSYDASDTLSKSRKRRKRPVSLAPATVGRKQSPRGRHHAGIC